MWTDSSLIYQIYPLGAVGAPFENDFKREGRVLKLKEWIKPLKELGVDAILFNPIYTSRSHGYNVLNLNEIDPRLGTKEDFKALADLIHENGMKIILDAVFNHVGRDHPYFKDVLEKREASPYKDWFLIDFNGNNAMNDGLWYQNWEGHDDLVKLNLKNPKVVDYLLEAVDGWIKDYGIEGLRLDVAYLLDPEFLKTLHHHVKAKDPEFFLLGETLHGDYNQWMNEEMLDSVTNYECYKGLYSSFNSKNFFEILYSFNRQFGKEPWCLYTGKHLLNFLDNHDVTRIASILENKAHLPLLYAMLFTMPGIPAIYYGSEWGLEGKKNADDTALRPEIKKLEKNELTKTIQKLAKIKHEQKALHTGDYKQLVLNNTYCLYERAAEGDRIWAAFNIDEKPITMQPPENPKALDLLSGQKGQARELLTLEPNTFKILKIEE